MLLVDRLDLGSTQESLDWNHVMASFIALQSNRRRPAIRRAPLVLLCFGIALNHTSVIFGLNLSVADVLAVILLILTALTTRLYIPTGPTIFFIALSVLVILVGGFVTPNVLSIPLTTSDVLSDYLKLFTSFCYFLLGVNIARTHQAKVVLRAFSLTAAIIGLIAVLQTGIPGMPRFETMFYGEYRFRGFMNDPNYFAVIQLAALALLWHDKGIIRKIRYPALIVLSTSVLSSGSKTGAIAMLVFFVWRLLAGLLNQSQHRTAASRIASAGLGLPILCGIIILTADPAWRFELATRIEEIPSLSRLAPLLVDFQSGVASGGSSRDSAWNNALSLIELSPLTGIGVGTYLEASSVVTGTPVLAHNTFLQIAAEWGLVFAAIFFVGVLFLVVKRPRTHTDLAQWSSTRDAILVMLVGSIGVSLNNARLFWFVLGITLAVHIFTGTIRKTSKTTYLEEINEAG